MQCCVECEWYVRPYPAALGPRAHLLRGPSPGPADTIQHAPAGGLSQSSGLPAVPGGVPGTVPGAPCGAALGTGSLGKRVRWHPSTESESEDVDDSEALHLHHHGELCDYRGALALMPMDSVCPPGAQHHALGPLPTLLAGANPGLGDDCHTAVDLDHDEGLASDRPPSPPPPPASRVRRLSSCLRSFFTHLFSNVGLFTLVGGYVLLGALLFESLEGGYEMNQRGNMKEHRDDCLRELWALTGERARGRFRCAECADCFVKRGPQKVPQNDRISIQMEPNLTQLYFCNELWFKGQSHTIFV